MHSYSFWFTDTLKEHFKPDDVVVVLFHDSGSRYVGKMFNDDWMRERGFLDEEITKAEDLIKEHIEEAFDHKNLNEDVPEFKDLNPTAEHIAYIIWNKLRALIAADKELEITLYETPRNFVTYKGL